jgi:MFS family permease
MCPKVCGPRRSGHSSVAAGVASMDDMNKNLDAPVRAAAQRSGTVRSGPGGGQAWWRAGLAVAAVGWGAQQFAPLLLMYQSVLHLSATTVQATFGLYVFGLIPGLLLGGPVSDRYGRRRVMVPTLAASLAATLLLMLGGEGQRLARPDRLAGLTAVYQAVSYVGFVAPFPLAAISRTVPPGRLLLAVAGLAALTLAFTAWGSSRNVRR